MGTFGDLGKVLFSAGNDLILLTAHWTTSGSRIKNNFQSERALTNAVGVLFIYYYSDIERVS